MPENLPILRLLCRLSGYHQAIERPVFVKLASLATSGEILQVGTYLISISVLVFFIVFAEFRLVQLTSSLTVSVFGNLKELFAVLVAVCLGDSFSRVNQVGLILCLVGNSIYFYGISSKVTRTARFSPRWPFFCGDYEPMHAVCTDDANVQSSLVSVQLHPPWEVISAAVEHNDAGPDHDADDTTLHASAATNLVDGAT